MNIQRSLFGSAFGSVNQIWIRHSSGWDGNDRFAEFLEIAHMKLSAIVTSFLRLAAHIEAHVAEIPVSIQ